MTRKARRHAPAKPETTTARASANVKEEPKAGGRSALEVLQYDGGLERGSALFLLAYLRVVGKPEDAETAVKTFRALRAQPWIWTALLAADVVRFTRALSACGMEPVGIGPMQGAMTALGVALPVLPPRAPAPAPAEDVPAGAV
jgi:hypothetical protein